MYCKNCGQEINDQAVICVHCGVATGGGAQPVVQQKTRIIGFILSFFISVAGLIVSIIEYKQAKEEGSNTGFALAGIIISAVSIAIGVITLIICMIMLAAILDYTSTYYTIIPMLFSV